MFQMFSGIPRVTPVPPKFLVTSNPRGAKLSAKCQAQLVGRPSTPQLG